MFIGTSQPTYLPWPGYFGLMNMCDHFIILDDVQFEKRSWQQRNCVKEINGTTYLSLSINSKGLRDQKINEALLADPLINFNKHIKTITNCYSKSEYFNDYKKKIFDVYEKKFNNLFELNYNLIITLKKILNINTVIKLSSEHQKSGKKENFIYSLLDNFGIKKYIINPGSLEYMRSKNENYELYLYNYNTNIEYKQNYGEFFPFISVIDMIFNIGAENAKSHIIKCSSIKKIN
jgi:hypothetical protein